jgi:ribosomal-protein-alanine N-acetyltransferase
MDDTATLAPTVTLRRATLEDGAALAALLCPEISSWVADWPDTMDEAVARQRIASELADAEDGSSLPMVIEIEQGRRAPVVAGWFRLRLASYDIDLAVMSCWIGRQFQGRGVAKDAVAAALALAMPELGALRVGAYAMRSNARSIRVLEECGLRYVGERLVPLPARGRTELLLCYERAAYAAIAPIQAEAAPVQRAA